MTEISKWRRHARATPQERLPSSIEDPTSVTGGPSDQRRSWAALAAGVGLADELILEAYVPRVAQRRRTAQGPRPCRLPARERPRYAAS